MEKLVFTYPEKCTGCRVCELICSIRHEGSPNPEKSRIKIARRYPVRGIPFYCRQCTKAPCIDACQVGALERDKKTGIVAFNKDKCIGCLRCVDWCPLGAMFLDKKIIKKCDLCSGDPVCVKYCSTGALEFTTSERLAEEKADAIIEFLKASGLI